MIYFEDWTIRTDGEVLARQYDDQSRTLSVSGQLPQGWTWVMLLQVGDAMDLLPLEETSEGLSTVLTAEQLSVFGYYKLQLRGTQGEVVRHTNIVSVYIPASLSGDAQWPTVPSEFTDIERRITEKAKLAENYAAHPPIIGENENWWAWDGAAYADTSKRSRGEQGVQGIQGEPGNTPQKGVDYFTQEDKVELIGQAESRFNTLYANALKRTASGAAVRMDDVSPLEHGVKVRVSGVDDLTAVTLTTCGKNLFNVENFTTQAVTTSTPYITEVGENYIKVTTNEGGSALGYCNTGKKLSDLCPNLQPGIKYVLNAKTDNTNRASFYLYGVVQWKFGEAVTITEEMLNANIIVYGLYEAGAVCTISDIQIELGDTATAYDPYQASAEYTPDEDGICDVTSVAYTMTLLTDHPNVVVDCEYNRDINKAFEQLVQAIISMGGNI